MPVRVIVPPDPLMTPAGVPGSHTDDDADVASMIAAATRTIDGPSGWVGRSFGPQTLELTASCWEELEHLPYGPVIQVVSISYVSADGVEYDVSDDDWISDGESIYFSGSWSHPPLGRRRYPIKVQYEAGYNGEDISSGGTGDVPEEAKAAIIASVQQLIVARSEGLGVRSVEVENIETITYLDADKVSNIIKNATSCYLSGLWVPMV